MLTSRFAPAALPALLLAIGGSASAAEHAGAAPATHMQLKDGDGAIVCFDYDTDADTAPIATGCPDGTYTEQLFDAAWNQIGEGSVTIGGDASGMVRSPTRVERTCTEGDFFGEFSGGTQGDNIDPYCRVTCPEGVVIDAEAIADTATGGRRRRDSRGRELHARHRHAGCHRLRRAPSGSTWCTSASPRSFGDLTYVIEAAAVCL